MKFLSIHFHSVSRSVSVSHSATNHPVQTSLSLVCPDGSTGRHKMKNGAAEKVR